MAQTLSLEDGKAWLDAIIRAYSQVLFSRSRVVGGLLMAATAFEPRMFAHGLLAVLVATWTARLLKFDDALISEGVYGYNALFVGLGTAALLESSMFSSGVLLFASVLTVLVTAAARSVSANNGLPILTAPFLLVYYLTIATTTSLGLSLALLPTGPNLAFLPDWLALYLKSLGMILFLPRLDVGLLMFAALVFHSRIATMFSLAALGISFLVMQVSALSVLAGDVFPLLLTLNLVFTAIGLGGVWFVPSRSSFLVGMVGAAAAAAATISTAPMLARFGLPILILPFNLTTWLVLYAMRQRTHDGAPKAVDFVPGTPEENFVFHRTHVSRFGAHYATRLRAPFSGVWTCTQGIDGEFTHQGVWRHAFDFEVMGVDGLVFRGEGATPQDYHCYNLPVLAPAAGTVVRVVNDIPDNLIGQPNLLQNWGNLVLINHAPGLYSLLCHLVPGSVTVFEGAWVVAGQQIGRCGNSGRSPVPHLHFQLQALPRVGAATIPTELHDVVIEAERPGLLSTAVIEKGQHVRNIRVDESLAAFFFEFVPGASFTIESNGRSEKVSIEIDLLGRKVMKSSLGGSMYFDLEVDRFIIYDVFGPRHSALHTLRAALPRVPFDDYQALTWEDHLPVGIVYGVAVKTAYEFVAPFLDKGGVLMSYRARREGSKLVIEGQSVAKRSGEPVFRTHIEFEPGQGWTDCWARSTRRTLACRRVPLVLEA